MTDSVELSCKEAARLMSRQQDMTLLPMEQEDLKQHLYICLSCRRFDEQLSFLRHLAKRYGESDLPAVE